MATLPKPSPKKPCVTGVPSPIKAKPTAPRRAPLAAFAPAPDPIDESKYPGTLQGDADVELGQIQAGFRDRMKAEAERFKSATDAGYYFVVAFESGEQAGAFLASVGVTPTNGGDLYIDGRVLADCMGIALPKADVRYNPGALPDRKLTALVRKAGR